MQKWWHVSPTRVVIALIAVIALIWMIGRAMQWLAPWTEARSMLRDNPTLARFPAPLADRSLSTVSGTPIVLFGLMVPTPWGAFGTIRSAPGLAIIPFPERHVEMLLYETHADSFEKAMWDDEAHISHARMDTRISGYRLMAAEMATRPDQVKGWRGRTRNEADSFLLEMKDLKLGGLRTIYTVDVGSLRGFQEGDPNVRPYRVRIDLFDSADRHYEIQIASENGGKSSFSQAEVNAVLLSLKPHRDN